MNDSIADIMIRESGRFLREAVFPVLFAKPSPFERGPFGDRVYYHRRWYANKRRGVTYLKLEYQRSSR